MRKKVLIIYANTDSVLRASVAAMLYSFDRYSNAFEVYYHNAILNRAPLISAFRRVDYVIFHHSVTTVWNRSRYVQKIDSWLSSDFGSAIKVALMQDEYKNVDLVQKFIIDLEIDRVFTLAPDTEWERIYGPAISNSGRLAPYLAGYLDSGTPNAAEVGNRQIDVGYRADWTKMHVKLGALGMLKRDIAPIVASSAKKYSLTTDIEVGSEHFIRGEKWNSFLQNCRYVIGVPSGSSVLDSNGEIEKHLHDRLNTEPDISEQQLYDEIVLDEEGSLALEVLSPRHLESMMNGCGQILVESDYNGILKPWIHYLPLKKDFSNVDEILQIVKDENLRLQMVRNCQRDIVDSGDYSYQLFVEMVLPSIEGSSVDGVQQKTALKYLNGFAEGLKGLLLRIIRRLV